jgi:hypothetical protein
MPPESLLAQWRDANRRAIDLERELFEAALLYSRGAGPEPAQDKWDEVERVRQHASELFKRAMREIDDAATAARFRVSRRQGSGGSSESGSPANG